MTYQELINQIRDLGFGDDTDMSDFGDLVFNDINLAISEISRDVAPIIKTYELEITGTDEGILYLKMPDVDDNFLAFTDTPVLFSKTTVEEKDGKLKTTETSLYEVFNNFKIESDDTIVIDTSQFNRSVPDKTTQPDEYRKASLTAYNIRIQYRAEHELFTGEEEQLSKQLPLPRDAHTLVPFLAAYYIWLDDEATKAAQYLNLYEQNKESVIGHRSGNKIRMRVIPGGI